MEHIIGLKGATSIIQQQDHQFSSNLYSGHSCHPSPAPILWHSAPIHYNDPPVIMPPDFSYHITDPISIQQHLPSHINTTPQHSTTPTTPTTDHRGHEGAVTYHKSTDISFKGIGIKVDQRASVTWHW